MDQNPKFHTHVLDNPIALLGRAFSLYWEKIHVLLSLAFVIFIVGLMQIFSVRLDSLSLVIFSSIAGILVSYVTYLAMIRVISNPVPMHMGQAYISIEHYILPAALVSILIVFVILGGALLFVIPAIIASVYVSFSVFAVIVDHYEKRDALTFSWHIVRGRWWQVLLRFIVANIVIIFTLMIVMAIFWMFGMGETPAHMLDRVRQGNNVIPIGQMILEQGIGDFFMMPLALCFAYVFYENLKQTVVKPLESEEKSEINWYIRTLAIVGAAFLVVSIFIAGFIIVRLLPDLVQVTHMPAAVYSIF